MGRVESTSRSRRLGVFRKDKVHARRRLYVALGVTLLFVAGLGRVWLTTAVADRSSRVHQLSDRIEQVDVDLSIADNELQLRRTYDKVHDLALSTGLQRGGEFHEVPLAIETPEPNGVAEQLASDLRRGSELILAEARAGDRPSRY